MQGYDLSINTNRRTALSRKSTDGIGDGASVGLGEEAAFTYLSILLKYKALPIDSKWLVILDLAIRNMVGFVGEAADAH